MKYCKVTKTIEFDMGHRVPMHASKCRNPHGHRYKVEVTCIGPIVENPGTNQGMVVDFGDLKNVMMEQIHDVFDHSFTFYALDESMQRAFNEVRGDGFKVNVVDFVPTAENFARYFYETMCKSLHGYAYTVDEVRVFETPTSIATYPIRTVEL